MLWICLGEIRQGCREHQRGEMLTGDVLLFVHAVHKVDVSDLCC